VNSNTIMAIMAVDPAPRSEAIPNAGNTQMTRATMMMADHSGNALHHRLD
jgi:hypothetical protein